MHSLVYTLLRVDLDKCITEEFINKNGFYEYSCLSIYRDIFLIIMNNSEPIIKRFKDTFQIRNIKLNSSLYLRLQYEVIDNDKIKICNKNVLKKL